MAALERPVPSPEAFLGQPWAAWVREAALPHTHCAAPPHSVDLEESGKEGGNSREVMRLNKEDMHLFGHYPAHDDFYLVVCNTCNQVIKPQVFQSHCASPPKQGVSCLEDMLKYLHTCALAHRTIDFPRLWESAVSCPHNQLPFSSVGFILSHIIGSGV